MNEVATSSIDSEIRAATELLERLGTEGVQLSVLDGRLRILAPHGLLTEAITNEIRKHRNRLLALIEPAHQKTSASVRGSGPGPLTPAQLQLWLHQQLFPDSSAYNLPFEAQLDGALDVAALEIALLGSSRRHEALHCRFPARAGVPRAEPEVGFPVLPIVDLSSLPEDRQSVIADWIAAAEASRPFDLTTGVGIRTVLVRFSAEQHRWLYTRHHIASDGYSMRIVMEDLAAEFQAARSGTKARLPDPGPRFIDVAERVNTERRQRGNNHDGSVQAWAEELLCAPSTLGVLRAVPQAAGCNAVDRVRMSLAVSDVRALDAIADATSSTRTAVILAAFSAVLGAYSGQERVVVGVPVAGRTGTELDRVVGCFATAAPLPLAVDSHHTLHQLTIEARRQLGRALTLPEVPVDELMASVRRHRVLSGNQLFAASLTVHGASPRAVLPGLDMTVLPSIPVSPKFPLALNVTPGPGGSLDAELEFDATRLAGGTAEEMFRATWGLVTASAEVPASPVGGLLFRHTAACAQEPAPREIALHRAVVERAMDRPDAVAVSHPDGHMTYGFLVRAAKEFSARLQQLGAGPEVGVGLCLPAGPTWVVSALAVLLAGSYYIPIDPADPLERRRSLVTRSRMTLVVSNEAQPSVRTIAPPSSAAGDVKARSVGRRLDTHAEQLAYVIHTSGSTGTPEPVGVTHANVTRSMASCRAKLGLENPDLVWSATHSTTFDFSVWEIWGALSAGAKVVIVPPLDVREPQQLQRVLERERIDVLSQTPTGLRQLLTGGRTTRVPRPRTLVLGGEPCATDATTEWLESADPSAHAYNLFGITETTVHSTVHELAVGDDTALIGRPLPGVRVEVRSSDGADVLPGALGELQVGGIGVSRGYLGRPARTAERFRPEPDGHGARIYCSGDLGRLRVNGRLEHLGRQDSQLQVRGHRVEPLEISSVASEHENVAACVVVPRTALGHTSLVAYVQPVGSTGGDISNVLRAHLAARLPNYAVPSLIVEIPVVPRTRNGKLDVGALPDAVLVRPPRPADEQPRTPTECFLAGAIAELMHLQAETVGLRDNVFVLGGDSLLVTQLHARVIEHYNVELPVRRVYQAWDVESLAEAVDASRIESDRIAVLSALADVEGEPDEPSIGSDRSQQ